MKKIEENNVKNIMISLILLICFILTIVISAFYTQNMEVRNWIDINIFRKKVTEEKAKEIPIDSDSYPYIYAYSKYITILYENKLTTYNEDGKNMYSLNINITEPIYSSEGEYLAIAEKGKHQAYLISEKNIIWETEVEGSISDIYVNKNGYVVLTIVDTSYKTVLIVYDSNGKELFKRHLATTSVVDVDISDDNSYLAIAQIDTSGILIQSKLEIISIEKARKNDSEYVVYTNKSKKGNIIISINYNNKNYLTCMYDNSIYTIKNNEEELLIELNAQKDVFASIDLKNYVFRIEEQGVDNCSKIYIKNVSNKKENCYAVDSVIKEINSCKDIIAINIGTEVYFINTSGYLIKKYTSNKEIMNIVLAEDVAGIVYRDNIKIIEL